ncbi:hypothetical protein GCM10012279_18030 [Micromonospora yangpuensis]|uniref:Uncharacterized protein n=1 Tax=Micromonospora yangpuensis TaxID=683228 RepID=A0A1C6TW04_9ACTN|nr:hypothetical protein GCM10012279_18030 [Micromonospora yangpuensis]SCL45976.1 hypothetical protein GA0070617_0105 [Micromonospora yangpuensis]
MKLADSVGPGIVYERDGWQLLCVIDPVSSETTRSYRPESDVLTGVSTHGKPVAAYPRPTATGRV